MYRAMGYRGYLVIRLYMGCWFDFFVVYIWGYGFDVEVTFNL